MIDETGWQVVTSNLGGYTGTESSNPVASESFQAQVYSQLVNLADCDPFISTLHFLHLVDESDRDRFQSGLLRLDDSVRPSATAVAGAIQQGCTSGQKGWLPATKVRILARMSGRKASGFRLPMTRLPALEYIFAE